jgi:hypothetical protein
MKKTFVAIFLMLFSCFLFADSYTVKAIKGANGNKGLAKIRQVGAITTGQEISDDDYVILMKGNYIELDNGYFIYDSGLVKDTVTNKRRILKNAKIVKASNIAGPVESTRKGVATAASRASEAKEDFDWDE